MLKCDYLVIGAGFAGSVLSERIANILKKKVILIDKRSDIGGNSIDEYDTHNVLIHKYGPHLFHTNNKTVYEYLSLFTEWRFYEHKVLAYHDKEFYQIPININTLNKFYNKNLLNENEVKNFLNQIRDPKKEIKNSEDIIVNKIGHDLFKAFFKHYTKKQWGYEPKDLNPGVCGRIPIRHNNDSRYFEDKYQIIPKNGYYKLFEEIVRNKNIKIILDKTFKEIKNNIDYKYLIFTGPIDEYFDYKFGKLQYRSVEFKFMNISVIKYQKVAQINFVDADTDYTRVVEYKHITGQKCNSTTISYEYPQKIGEPFYPIPNKNNIRLYKKYLSETSKFKNVIFCGRLAEYQYYNMDQVISRALYVFNKYIKND